MPRRTLMGCSSLLALSCLALCAISCGDGGDSLAANGGSAEGAGKTAAGGTAAASGAGSQAGRGGVMGSAGSKAGSGAAGHASSGQGGHEGAAGDAAVGGDDAGVASCAPCVDGSLSWGDIGGLVANTERSTLDSCNTYHRTRTPAGRGASDMLACERSLPCMGSGLHGVNDVLQALQNADVQAALAQGHVLFGNDPRPVDGTVLEIVARADTSIEVGGSCSGGASCSAIPAGVSALAKLLRAIDDEQLHLEPCLSTFAP